MSRNKKIILTAVLLAMHITLSRLLSIQTPISKTSFAFVPTMLCAVWLGPKWTVLLNVLADLIGAIFFPIGTYFVGYTIGTAIAGFIYGIILYKKEEDSYKDFQFIIRLTVSTILVAIIVNMGLTNLWMSITNGKAFIPIFLSRLPKHLIMIPVHIIVIFALEKILRIPFDKYVRSNDD